MYKLEDMMSVKTKCQFLPINDKKTYLFILFKRTSSLLKNKINGLNVFLYLDCGTYTKSSLNAQKLFLWYYKYSCLLRSSYYICHSMLPDKNNPKSAEVCPNSPASTEAAPPNSSTYGLFDNTSMTFYAF